MHGLNLKNLIMSPLFDRRVLNHKQKVSRKKLGRINSIWSLRSYIVDVQLLTLLLLGYDSRRSVVDQAFSKQSAGEILRNNKQIRFAKLLLCADG